MRQLMMLLLFGFFVWAQDSVQLNQTRAQEEELLNDFEDEYHTSATHTTKILLSNIIAGCTRLIRGFMTTP